MLTPGPAVLYIVARSVEQGRIAGLASVCGITTGTLVHVLAASLGLSALLASSALAFAVVKFAGAGYLIYIGLRRILSCPDVSIAQSELPVRSLGRLYRDGFVDPGRGAVTFQIAFLGLLFTVMGLMSDGLYALIAGTAGRWVKRQGDYLRWERYLTGGVFIGLGVTAALDGNGRK